MEVIGQGFGLPIDQVSSIRDSISVYEGWLLEREVLCPAAVREWKGDVEQRVWQTIFEQFSLLFQPRPRSEMASLFVVGGGGSSGAASGSGTSKSGREQNLKDGDNAPLDPLSVHVDLCHRVLRIITTATWILGPEFTEETWIVLLKVLIGITDCLLREPVAEGKDKDMPHSSSLSREKERDKHQAIVFEGEDPGPRMADELCEHLIRVLVEVWLRSGVMEVYMWDHLKVIIGIRSRRDFPVDVLFMRRVEILYPLDPPSPGHQSMERDHPRPHTTCRKPSLRFLRRRKKRLHLRWNL